MNGLITTSRLSLKVADEIATKVIDTAIRNSFKPITVTVMDPTGNAIVTKRMDDCPPMLYPKIALAKAHTCVALKASSRAYGANHVGSSEVPAVPALFSKALNMVNISGGQLAAFPGGVLVRSKNCGSIVGSVGVSGALGDEDEYCALSAIKDCSIADELQTEPEEHSCKTSLDPEDDQDIFAQ